MQQILAELREDLARLSRWLQQLDRLIRFRIWLHFATPEDKRYIQGLIQRLLDGRTETQEHYAEVMAPPEPHWRAKAAKRARTMLRENDYFPTWRGVKVAAEERQELIKDTVQAVEALKPGDLFAVYMIATALAAQQEATESAQA